MAETDVQRRPIRGGLWGILLGLGLALLALNSKIISLSIVSLALVTVIGIVLGAAWGMFAPARPPKGPAPVGDAPVGDAPAGDAPAGDAPVGEPGDGAPPVGDTESGESVPAPADDDPHGGS